jgi:hypothetical protein
VQVWRPLLAKTHIEKRMTPGKRKNAKSFAGTKNEGEGEKKEKLYADVL